MNLCFYWINLEQDITRRNSILDQFKKYNIKNVRIEAIAGSTTKGKIIACTQSHIKAINTFMTTNNNFAIICEDDLSFEWIKYWNKNIDQIILNAPSDWEIIQLAIIITGSKLNNEFYTSDTNYLPHLRHYWSTLCYIINRKGAKKIMNLTLDINQVDKYTADCILYSTAKTYTYKYPMFTYIDNNTSHIHPTHIPVHEKSKKIIEQFLKSHSEITAK